MSAPTDPLAWVAVAEEDFLPARSALRRKHPLPYGACFYAQQCAEKYLKAILIARGQAFPKTHDLLALNELISQASSPLKVNADQLDALSSYAVRVRYPGEEPTVEEARKAMDTVRIVRRLARAALNIKK